MDPPQALPPLLAGGGGVDAEASPERARPVVDGQHVHGFDVASRTAPTCPAFGGVAVVPDFLSRDAARDLLERIECTPFLPSQGGRTKQHYGARFNFNRRRMNADRFEGLPHYGPTLAAAARAALSALGDAGLDAALAEFVPTDVFVLRYAPERGSNLDLHLDDVHAYGELILDVSLESDSVLTFFRGRPGGEVPLGDRPPPEPAAVRVPVPARSLVAIFGPARFAWEHGLLASDVIARRTSITLRTLAPPLRETDAGRRLLAACRPA